MSFTHVAQTKTLTNTQKLSRVHFVGTICRRPMFNYKVAGGWAVLFFVCVANSRQQTPHSPRVEDDAAL